MAVGSGPTGAASSGSAASLSFRPDIEGLRAVAVGLVVLLHAGVTTVSGGYVGVDVFFVISGFLITSLLLDELRRSRRVSILGFYARRARRILPAASVVIAVTVVATYVALGPLAGRNSATDGKWATFFAANFRFIHQGTDYFASNLPPSPLQHYWSLAVEEQFYLVWPSLLFGLVALGRSFGRSVLTLRIGLIALVAGSLYWSIHETSLNPTTAYFSPVTRAWELGVGALIVTFAAVIGKLPSAVRAAATWAGLAAIAAAAFRFTSATPFPGYMALLPVLGSGLIIAGGIGSPAGSAGLLLGTAPLRLIGKLSFSIYLWHWPVFIVAEQHSPTPLTNTERAACVLLTLGLAAVTYLAVETPLRSTSLLRERNPRTDWQASRRALVVGVLAVMLAFNVSSWTGYQADLAINGLDSAPLRATGSLFAEPTTATTDRTASTGDRSTKAPALAPVTPALAQRRFLDLQNTAIKAVSAATQLTKVPSNVDPSVLWLKQLGWHTPDRTCQMEHADSTVKVCYYGDRFATRTLFMVGDSHAVEWLWAVDIWAMQRGFRVAFLYKQACSLALNANSENGPGNVPFPECTQWRAAAIKTIVAAKPEYIILTNAHNDSNLSEDALHAGYRAAFQELAGAGARRIIQIGDNADLPQDPGLCLSRPSADLRACAGHIREAALNADAATAKDAGVGFIDVGPWFCTPDGTCPVIIDDRIAYWDSNHISYEYAVDIEPVIGAALDYQLLAK